MSPNAEGRSERGARPAALRRLGLFVADLEGGGAERMMVRLAGGIAEHGVAVDLVAASARGPYVEEVPATVHLIDLARGGSGAAILPLAAYLRRSRPEVLVSTLHHASLAAELARRIAFVPTLHFVREASTPSARPVSAGAKARAIALGMRWTYAAADGVLAVSEGVAAGLREHRGVAPAKIATVYNPVVDADLAAKAAEDPGHPWFAPGAPPVVLAVGSLRPVKGLPVLLRAFARLRATREVRLVVLGEGPQRVELERLASSLGIADAVSLPGFAANPFAHMARAAVYVLASEREGLPGALVQAMACGCPVVSTDCASGPREILEDGVHGALVPVGDVEALAAALGRALDQPGDRRARIARADRFARERVVLAHLEALEGALRRRAPIAARRRPLTGGAP